MDELYEDASRDEMAQWWGEHIDPNNATASDATEEGLVDDAIKMCPELAADRRTLTRAARAYLEQRADERAAKTSQAFGVGFDDGASAARDALLDQQHERPERQRSKGQILANLESTASSAADEELINELGQFAALRAVGVIAARAVESDFTDRALEALWDAPETEKAFSAYNTGWNAGLRSVLAPEDGHARIE
jgi:hypothetical protein